MRTRTPLLILLAICLLWPASAARADLVRVEPPRAVYLVEKIDAQNTRDLGVVDFSKPDGVFTPWLAGQPSGGYDLAVHAATGRWVLSFDRLSNGDPLVIGGKPFESPKGVVVLVLGELDKILSTQPGDKACVAIKCFEHAYAFSPDGSVFLTMLLRSSYSSLNRYLFAAGAKAQALVTTRTTKKNAEVVSVTADGKQLAYWSPTTGLYVEALPTAWLDAKQKPTAPKQSKPIAHPKLILAGPLLLADKALVYFRREPTEQKLGFIEVLDTTSKQAWTAFTFPTEFPMWSEGMLYVPARRLIVFFDGDHSLMLFSLDKPAEQARVLTDNARILHDVSADGRFLLFTRFKDWKQLDRAANPHELCVLDLDTGKVVAVARHAAKTPRYHRAFFLNAAGQ